MLYNTLGSTDATPHAQTLMLGSHFLILHTDLTLSQSQSQVVTVASQDVLLSTPCVFTLHALSKPSYASYIVTPAAIIIPSYCPHACCCGRCALLSADRSYATPRTCPPSC